MKIGITGIIGSGKSTVLKLLEDKGYHIYDSDKEVHKLLETKSVVDEISKHFDCVENGVINRKKLGGIVFNNDEKLQLLNSIIHPLVKAQIKSLDGLVFVDVPLLYETGFEVLFDKVIAVLASEETLINRLKERNNLSSSEAKKRISLQMDSETKQKLADYVIINEGTVKELELKLNKVLEVLDV